LTATVPIITIETIGPWPDGAAVQPARPS
jgi:hypothetical protein